jgi:hypothetical protein
MTFSRDACILPVRLVERIRSPDPAYPLSIDGDSRRDAAIVSASPPTPELIECIRLLRISQTQENKKSARAI